MARKQWEARGPPAGGGGWRSEVRVEAEEEDFQGSARCQVGRFRADASRSDAAAASLAFFIPRVGAVLWF